MEQDSPKDLLQTARVIAVVGYSDKPHRDSYRVGAYLRTVGYRVYPVNPKIESVDGLTCYPSLATIPEPIDLVDVFRRPEFLPEVVEQAIAVRARALWTQLGVVHPAAIERAREAGLITVVNRCIMVDHRRLFG